MIPSSVLCVIVPLASSARDLSNLFWSLRRQEGLSFEVIVTVDSASHPEVAAVARTISRSNGSVRLLDAPTESGIGSAIAAALAQTSATYVTVADRDGVCVDGGYQALVASMESSSSDLAVGSAERFGKKRGRISRAVDGALDVEMRAGRLADRPGLIAVDLLSTIVSRRDLIEAVFDGSEVRSERQAVARLLTSASTIDVIPRPVVWRRDPRASTKMWTGSADRVQDYAVVRSIVAKADMSVRECHARAVVTRDLLPSRNFDEQFAGVSISALSDLMRDLLSDLQATSLSNISIDKRWQLAVIALGHTKLLPVIASTAAPVRADQVPLFDESRLPVQIRAALGVGGANLRSAFVECFAFAPGSMHSDVSSGSSDADMIEISVVIPCLNVVGYIDELILSIRSAVGVRLEVVVVDDGSTDGTWERLLVHQADDPRVRVFRSPGAGGGQARNFGVEVARGEYLVFADGDDLVPPSAYSRMLRVARRSGADIVSGNYLKFFSTSTWSASSGFNHAYRRPVEGISVDEHPQLARHRAVWNRLIRREHWLEHALPFPGVPRSNDIVAMTSAILSARSLAVTPEPVYVYRSRPGSGSMTSGVGSAEYTISYFSEEATCSALIAQRGSQGVDKEYWAMVLRSDAWGNILKYLDLRSSDLAPDQGVATAIDRLLSRVPITIFRSLAAEHQAIWVLAASGRFEEAQTMRSVFDSSRNVSLERCVVALEAVASQNLISREAVGRLTLKYLIRRVLADAAGYDGVLSHAVPLVRDLLTDESSPLSVVPATLEERLTYAIASGNVFSALAVTAPATPSMEAQLRSGLSRVELSGLNDGRDLSLARVVARRYGDASRERTPIGHLTVDDGKWSVLIETEGIPPLGVWVLELEYQDEFGMRRASLRLREATRRGKLRRLQRIVVVQSKSSRSLVRVAAPFVERVRRKVARLFRV